MSAWRVLVYSLMPVLAIVGGLLMAFSSAFSAFGMVLQLVALSAIAFALVTRSGSTRPDSGD